MSSGLRDRDLCWWWRRGVILVIVVVTAVVLIVVARVPTLISVLSVLFVLLKRLKVILRRSRAMHDRDWTTKTRISQAK